MSDVPGPHPQACRRLQIEALRQQLARWEEAGALQNLRERPVLLERNVLSSGCPALDAALPEKGFRPGTLVEWLFSREGDGTATLAFRTAASIVRAVAGASRGGAVVVLDRSGEFYPPAAVAQGIEPERLIVVHPGNKADHTWALDQALRCPAVVAVVAWPDALAEKLDGRTFRRLQLAVEQGGGLGLLIRPESVCCLPSWAGVRLLVESLPSNSPYGRPRQMRVTLLRCRGGRGEQTINVEIDDDFSPGSPAGEVKMT
jgi:protein ImuA